MTVTATEFKTGFGKYLEMLLYEDVFITKNGKTVAKVSRPGTSAVDSISGILSGYIPDSYGRDELRSERLSKHESDG